MDTSKYKGEILRQLSDQKEILNKAVDDEIINEKMFNYLFKQNPKTPNFYVLPKIHKDLCDPPGRPIVASIDSLFSRISKFLEKVLTPLVRQGRSFLKDTGDFLIKIKNFSDLPEDIILATWDVSSLYTIIPHVDGLNSAWSSLVEKVMPSNTFYFTILRNPIDVMESSFSYFRTRNAFGKAKNLEDFLKNSSVFYHPNANISFFAKNFMTFDLGFDHNGIENSKHFLLTCRMVEATFNLVLITEYVDESLILLKDALCWSLDDVVAFPLNIRSNSSKVSLSLETQQKIKKWNQLDWQLYNYFNKTFWNKVETFGRERMQREVEELKRKRALLVETCLLGEGIVDPDNLHDKSMMPYQPGLAKILGYNLKQTLRKAEQLMCKRMVTPEIQYTGQLHTKQEIKKSAPKAIPSYNKTRMKPILHKKIK
ncbi:galactose-3-O-sulfotransferase 2-like [Bombina bombina]|uniref:galactose-3-O-sulfotransferase 2-like n=1 Tax=Bombina bombina TaxID=8345 RepID=UPI00235A9FB4|nr:galactose-3-O-sulfotransferase 2-like [Bombina bombina]